MWASLGPWGVSVTGPQAAKAHSIANMNGVSSNRDSQGDPGTRCQIEKIAEPSHSNDPFGDGLEMWLPNKR